MPPSLQQLLAASSLIVTCERIVALGVLPEAEEQKLRDLIVKACKAFEMPTVCERRTDNVVPFGLDQRHST